MLHRLLCPCLLAFSFAAHAQSQPPEDSPERARALRHAEPSWQLMAPYLPDPATGTPEQLETAADVLRARRMPEDALDFYTYALERGGPELRLRNRLGITNLELHRTAIARIHFKRVLTLDRNFAEAWNNLGAVEYVAGNYSGARADYLRAIKLNPAMAIYHSNLGTAYFELKDFESARQQFGEALRLDPAIFDRADGNGVQAHVMNAHDRGRFCIEMAKLAASHHDDAGVLRWLEKATATEDNLAYTISDDPHLRPYAKDPRVLVLLSNARTLRTHQLARSVPVPPLPAEEPK